MGRKIASVVGLALALSLGGASAFQGEVSQPADPPKDYVALQTYAMASGKNNDYSFAYRGKDGKPGRWNPCETHSWKYNPAGQKAGGLKDAKRAIRLMSKETGVKFVYRGKTKVNAGNAKAPNVADLVVGWADAKSKAFKSVQGKVPKGYSIEGVTLTWVGWTRYGDGSYSPYEIEKASILLNRKSKLPRSGRKHVFLHESGHLAGLGHSKKRGPVMTAHYWSGAPSTWTASDRNGLKKLSKARGCIKR